MGADDRGMRFTTEDTKERRGRQEFAADERRKTQIGKKSQPQRRKPDR
jgi:hypothetical protein